MAREPLCQTGHALSSSGRIAASQGKRPKGRAVAEADDSRRRGPSREPSVATRSPTDNRQPRWPICGLDGDDVAPGQPPRHCYAANDHAVGVDSGPSPDDAPKVERGDDADHDSDSPQRHSRPGERPHDEDEDDEPERCRPELGISPGAGRLLDLVRRQPIQRTVHPSNHRPVISASSGAAPPGPRLCQKRCLQRPGSAAPRAGCGFYDTASAIRLPA